MGLHKFSNIEKTPFYGIIEICTAPICTVRTNWGGAKISSGYRYFAVVRYNNTTVKVGLSEEMWEQKDNVTPILVLRKKVPYCFSY